MIRRAIALGGLLVVAAAAPAAAQQYPPDTNIMTVSATCPTPGETLAISAQTFAPGADVTVSLASTPAVLGTTTANGDGVATFEVTIPADAAPGTHTLTATGPPAGGGDVELTAALDLNSAITVCSHDSAASPASNDTPSGTLPRTGDDSSVPLAQIGLALAAAGGVLMAFASRRRKRAATA